MENGAKVVKRQGERKEKIVLSCGNVVPKMILIHGIAQIGSMPDRSPGKAFSDMVFGSIATTWRAACLFFYQRFFGINGDAKNSCS